MSRVFERLRSGSGPRAALCAPGLLVVVASLLTMTAGAAQAASSVRAEAWVWQCAWSPGEVGVGARPAHGSWRAPGTLPPALDDGVSLSGRYRYGDIAIDVEWRISAAPLTVEVCAERHVEHEGVIYISPRGCIHRRAGPLRTL